MLTLQPVGPDDWRTWRALRLRALAADPSAFGSTLAQWQGEGDRERRWRDRLDPGRTYHLVALLDDEPVGMAGGLRTDVPDVVDLISMWVAPEARGNGVARALIDGIEAWAAGRANTLRLCVMPHNAAAITAYERAGFTLTDEPGDLLADGSGRELVMSKRVDPRRP